MSKLNLAAHMLQNDDDDDDDNAGGGGGGEGESGGGSGAGFVGSCPSPLGTGRCRAESIASALGSSFDEDPSM